MLPHSVYSLVLQNIQRYTRTHYYIKSFQEIPPYEFQYIFHICISSTRKHIVSHHSQKLSKLFFHMTTPCNFAKNTGWGRANHKKCPQLLFPLPLNTYHCTIRLQLHTKRLNPTEAYVFDLLPTFILMDN